MKRTRTRECVFEYQKEKTEGLPLTEISKNESGKRELKARKWGRK